MKSPHMHEKPTALSCNGSGGIQLQPHKYKDSGSAVLAPPHDHGSAAINHAQRSGPHVVDGLFLGLFYFLRHVHIIETNRVSGGFSAATIHPTLIKRSCTKRTSTFLTRFVCWKTSFNGEMKRSIFNVVYLKPHETRGIRGGQQLRLTV